MTNSRTPPHVGPREACALITVCLQVSQNQFQVSQSCWCKIHDLTSGLYKYSPLLLLTSTSNDCRDEQQATNEMLKIKHNNEKNDASRLHRWKHTPCFWFIIFTSFSSFSNQLTGTDTHSHLSKTMQNIMLSWRGLEIFLHFNWSCVCSEHFSQHWYLH